MNQLPHDSRRNGATPLPEGCALVTGAARGIGAAIAEALSAEGWPVAVNYSADADGAREVAERITAAGGRALTIQADVSDAAAVDTMFATAEEHLGPVLVLVNNAGIRRDRLVAGLQADDWARVLDVNLTGTFNTTKRAVGPMVRRRFGRVVNVSTISASMPLPGQSAYAASKAGIEALTKTLAMEVARRGVTSNAVAPGLVDTTFVPDQADDWGSSVPVKRLAQPGEIARAVAFLASPDAGYVNGVVLTVDGGLTAGIGLGMLSRSRESAGATSTKQ